jgi:hypothetical protein
MKSITTLPERGGGWFVSIAAPPMLTKLRQHIV